MPLQKRTILLKGHMWQSTTDSYSDIVTKSSWVRSYNLPVRLSNLKPSRTSSRLSCTLLYAPLCSKPRDVLTVCDILLDLPHILPCISLVFHCLCWPSTLQVHWVASLSNTALWSVEWAHAAWLRILPSPPSDVTLGRKETERVPTSVKKE